MIDAGRVKEIILACLFGDNEDQSDMVMAKGITRTFGFHPGRLETHKAEIAEMLRQLPKEFHNDGWSFLNACVDHEGNQWGEHQNVEELFALGQAIGVVRCPLPREMWGMLPGGMPYYTIHGLGGTIEVQVPTITEETE